MAEFKSEEEYEKWKDSKTKLSQANAERDEKNAPSIKQSNNKQSDFKVSKKVAFLIIGVLIILTALITLLLSRRPTDSTSSPSIAATLLSNSGRISGNIFVTMKSGDIKKGAGITVTLLKNQDTILNGFKQIQQEYTQPLLELAQTLDKVKELQNNASTYIEALHLWNDTVPKAKQLDASYNDKLNALFIAHVYKTVQSDVNGSYDFTDIPYGKYCLLTEFTVFETRTQWLEPLEIKQKDTKLDLTNNNAKDVYQHMSEGMKTY